MRDWIDTERERLFAEAARRDAEAQEDYLRHVAAVNTGHHHSRGPWAYPPRKQPRGNVAARTP